MSQNFNTLYLNPMFHFKVNLINCQDVEPYFKCPCPQTHPAPVPLEENKKREFLIARQFFMTKDLSKKPMMRVLPEAEKLEFLKTLVSWIEGRDIMDTCFVLNFGYEAPSPWPQVLLE